MRDVTLEELLEAGCHFGHQVTRSNPKAREFIFEERDNIHIIDLAKTREWLMEAAQFIKDLASKPSSTLIVVGTKRQARPIVEREVKRAREEVKDPQGKDGLMYVTVRWIGGLFTNFSEVSKNLKKLEDLNSLLTSETERAKYTKKELGLFEKEKDKLLSLYGGIEKIKKEPDAIFVIDSHLEELAIKEAGRTGVSTVAIVDTNADPGLVDYPIAANDDAVGSIEIITKYIIDAWIEGRNKSAARSEKLAEEAKKEVAQDKAKKGEIKKKTKPDSPKPKVIFEKNKTEEKETN